MNFQYEYKYKNTGFEKSVAFNDKRNPGYSNACVLNILQYFKHRPSSWSFIYVQD